MKKELLLMLLSLAKEKGGELKNVTTRKKKRLFLKLNCSSSGPQAPLLPTPTLLYFSFILSFFFKNIQQSNTHTGERETIYDPSLNPTVCVFSASAGFFPLNRQLKILFFSFFLSFSSNCGCVCVCAWRRILYVFTQQKLS